ncbi:hypothetical protein ACWEPL_20560 [Nonomuraea sp. NPDC004186]|uniref:hypothetical protein n=1 Tax=Nonomuraea sp. NPDC049625 TaxID=3155775 RepID=UPI00343DBCA9
MAATTRTTGRGTAYFPRLAAERLDIAPHRASAAVTRAAEVHAAGAASAGNATRATGGPTQSPSPAQAAAGPPGPKP